MILNALGDLSSVPEDLQPYVGRFTCPPKRRSTFRPIPNPRPNDWLANFPEPGQTLWDFKRVLHCAKPDTIRRTILIQPLGHSFDSPRVCPLELVRRYVLAFFFGLDCTVLPVQSGETGVSGEVEDADGTVSSVSIRDEIRPVPGVRVSGDIESSTLPQQLWTTSVIRWIEGNREKMDDEDLKTSEVATIGIVYPFDLYNAKSWNFVFGIAHVHDKLGCYSFARFDPAFPFHERKTEDEIDPDTYRLILKRSFDTVTHELCHLFGLEHCVYFSCLMQGSNHLDESDRTPMFLCPVCLRKLWERLKFDFRERYLAMRAFFVDVGLADEANWVEGRLDELGEGVGEEEENESSNDLEELELSIVGSNEV